MSWQLSCRDMCKIVPRSHSYFSCRYHKYFTRFASSAHKLFVKWALDPRSCHMEETPRDIWHFALKMQSTPNHTSIGRGLEGPPTGKPFSAIITGHRNTNYEAAIMKWGVQYGWFLAYIYILFSTYMYIYIYIYIQSGRYLAADTVA